MSMNTKQGELAAQMAADLSVLFARRHSAQGRHDLAASSYSEAATLYRECGCEVFAAGCTGAAEDERRLSKLYAYRSCAWGCGLPAVVGDIYCAGCASARTR